jgi:hypothetical protein
MRWRVRPSEPQAIFTAIVGAAIIAMNVWSAFSPRGGLYRVDADDRDR